MVTKCFLLTLTVGNFVASETISTIVHEKVQVGKDQEKAQSEKDSHSKNRDGKKLNKQSSTYTMKTYRKPNGQLFSQ